MALNIKNDEADRLARHLAHVTGESITEAVTTALRERLAQVEGVRRAPSIHDEVRRIQERIAALPVLDPRSDEEILGYDAAGLPR
jgi:antitoxin VapB